MTKTIKTAVAALLFVAGACNVSEAAAERLVSHSVKVDTQGKLLSWISEPSPFHRVMALGWHGLKSFPLEPNGLKPYFTYSRFDGFGENPSLRGIWWAHNPAGLGAMFVDSALPYYAYSGDREVIAIAREMLDHQLEHGTTPADWAWSRVPFASAFPGETKWQGADDRAFCWKNEPCGRGDGVGFIEPDKVGEVGLAYLKFYQFSAEPKYLVAALHCAEALAKHIRVGTYDRSPWPFRVDGRTGKQVREEYSSNVIGAIKLFDELTRMKLGRTKFYAAARKNAWDWMMRYPMKNHNWQGYFEDIPIFKRPDQNPNQYSALESIKYILLNPQLDAQWNEHARDTLEWVREVFGGDVHNRFGIEPGVQWGAEVISEQGDDMAKMGSHTARYASVLALLHELTGEVGLRSRAWRSFNWATYVCNERGVVKVGTNDDEGYWFSDGYGDYMRHFLVGMSAVPTFAPADQNHILRSSSVVRSVSYGEDSLSYRTFDSSSEQVIKLAHRPSKVSSGSILLSKLGALPASASGYTVRQLEDGAYLLKVRHHSPTLTVSWEKDSRP